MRIEPEPRVEWRRQTERPKDAAALPRGDYRRNGARSQIGGRHFDCGRSALRSMHSRLLETAAAIGRADSQPNAEFVAFNLDGDFGAGGTAAPNLTIKIT
jgi:hypothetical protein